MTKHNLSFEERFILHIQKSDNSNSCWEWTGAKNQDGYGAFGINHKTYLAHRVSFALFVGMIPDGMEVCHFCDNPGCINPSHLWLGTHQENVNDMVKKGRTDFIGQRGENHKLHKLKEYNVFQIREMIEQGYTHQEIANVFGVSEENVSRIKSGKNWGWLK